MKQHYMEPDIEKYVTTRQNHLEYKRFQGLFLIDIIGYEAYANMKSSLFSEWLFSKITIHLFSIFHIFWWFLPILYWCYRVYSEQSLESLTFLLFFVAFWIGLIHTGYKSFRRIAVYKKTLRYLESKDTIVSEREKLETSIANDVNNGWIDVAILWDIKKCIVSILEWYRIISVSHEYILNHKWYFGRISREWQEVINKEFQWIVAYSQEFTLLVQSWISHHATELAELEKQIASQELSTENTGWKAALEISRISLQEHLRELEKVKV